MRERITFTLQKIKRIDQGEIFNSYGFQKRLTNIKIVFMCDPNPEILQYILDQSCQIQQPAGNIQRQISAVKGGMKAIYDLISHRVDKQRKLG